MSYHFWVYIFYIYIYIYRNNLISLILSCAYYKDRHLSQMKVFPPCWYWTIWPYAKHIAPRGRRRWEGRRRRRQRLFLRPRILTKGPLPHRYSGCLVAGDMKYAIFKLPILQTKVEYQCFANDVRWIEKKKEWEERKLNDREITSKIWEKRGMISVGSSISCLWVATFRSFCSPAFLEPVACEFQNACEPQKLVTS